MNYILIGVSIVGTYILILTIGYRILEKTGFYKKIHYSDIESV